MNKIFTIFGIVSCVFLLSSWKSIIVKALENPEPELFALLYSNEEYSILKRSGDTSGAYTSIGYGIGWNQDVSCLLGSYHKINYRVLYKDQYYDIIEADKLGLYTVDDLKLMGINVICQNEDGVWE